MKRMSSLDMAYRHTATVSTSSRRYRLSLRNAFIPLNAENIPSITKAVTAITAYAMARLTSDDAGKRIVDSNGEELGIVDEVTNGTAHVNPDPGLTDQIRAKLGWGEADQEDFVLQEDRIDTVTDDEIRLRE